MTQIDAVRQKQQDIQNIVEVSNQLNSPILILRKSVDVEALTLPLDHETIPPNETDRITINGTEFHYIKLDPTSAVSHLKRYALHKIATDLLKEKQSITLSEGQKEVAICSTYIKRARG